MSPAPLPLPFRCGRSAVAAVRLVATGAHTSRHGPFAGGRRFGHSALTMTDDPGLHDVGDQIHPRVIGDVGPVLAVDHDDVGSGTCGEMPDVVPAKCAGAPVGRCTDRLVGGHPVLAAGERDHE